MNVLIISGTDHKGSTYNIGRIIAEKVSKADEISEVFLPHDFGKFCCGCTNCFEKNETICPHYEMLSPITEKIDSADVIIFTTPVYVYHATGQMKALLDHYGWRWMVHRPEEKMFSKQAVVVSTAAGAGMKSAIKDIADSCFFWGIPKTYKLGIGVQATRWSEIKPAIRNRINSKTDSIAKQIISKNGKVSVPFKTRVMFSIMKMAHKNGFNEADDRYWKDKGWLDGKKPWKQEV